MRILLVALLLVPVYCHRVYAEESAPEARPGARLVSCLDVKDFAAETVRIGDLNADGAPDLLFVQSHLGSRAITCLTATTITGAVLWQTGVPSADHGRIYSDLPVQIYDWDNDGWNEVLYVQQAVYAEPPYDGRSVRERAARYEGDAMLIVLAGRTGQEKSRLPLPAPADDCFLFANLTGGERPEDLVVKDRYWNVWGVAHDGRVLWHWNGATGHFPAVADVDDDGRDETFVGFALIDDDGKVLFTHDAHDSHQDACFAVRPADTRWRLLFGNAGLHCLSKDGTELWQQPMGECQHVVAGRFRTDSELQLVSVDRTPVVTHRRDANAWAILYLHDLNGNEIWRKQQEPGAWAIAPLSVRWSGVDAPQDILVYGHGAGRPAVIYRGDGELIDELPMCYTDDRTAADRQADYYVLVADVWGDGREEVILFGSRGACIYANARPLAVPTLVNETLYPGM
ncbi:MAG: rhamnogalacturonan lyase family protein [Pirellulaceae bacterium]